MELDLRAAPPRLSTGVVALDVGGARPPTGSTDDDSPTGAAAAIAIVCFLACALGAVARAIAF